MDDFVAAAAQRVAASLKVFAPEAQRAVLRRAAELLRSPGVAGGTDAPPGAEPDAPANGAPRTRTTKEELASLAAQVLEHVSAREGVSASTVALAFPEHKDGTVRDVLRSLVASGKIRMEGEKRTAVYLRIAEQATP